MIIHLGSACNNNCTICPKDRCIIADRIPKDAKDDKDTYFIVGGEPTIQDIPLTELADEVLKKNPDAKIVLCTNGRMFTYKNYVKSLIYSGINNFIIFLPSFDAEWYKKVTGTEYGYSQVIRGLQHLTHYPVSIQIITDDCIDKIDTKKKACSFGSATVCNKVVNRFQDSMFKLILGYIRSHYDISPTKISPLWSSNYNLNYRIESVNRNYFLKISGLIEKEEMKRRIRLEQSILTHLHKEGFPTSVAVPTKKKEFFIEFQNQILSIYTFVEGSFLQRDPKQIVATIAQIAHMHEALSSLGSKPVIRFLDRLNRDSANMRELLSSKEMLGRNTTLNKHSQWLQAEMEAVQRDIIEKYQGIEEINIHGDLRAENILFHEGQIRIIDFQNSFFGPQMYDYASYLAGLRKLEDFETMVNECIREYAKLTITNHQELRILKSLMKFYLLTNIEKREREIGTDDKIWLEETIANLAKIDRINISPEHPDPDIPNNR